jgi:ATP:ADP antiporter, AAA family
VFLARPLAIPLIRDGTTTQNNLLKGAKMRFFRNFFNLKKEELMPVSFMSIYFLLVITTFWIMKPLKKTLFISHYDEMNFQFFNWSFNAAQTELLAKCLNMFVAFLAFWVFSKMAKRFQKEKLTHLFGGFFMVFFIYWAVRINTPSVVDIWGFYIFGDLFVTLMCACFFSFLNDSVTPDMSKRLYSFVILGGVVGGVIGTSLVRVWLKLLSLSEWMSVCVLLIVATIFCGYQAAKAFERLGTAQFVGDTEAETDEKLEDSAIEIMRKVFSKKYLLGIISLVVMYEMVSTLFDFQFTSAVSHFLSGKEIGAQFANVYLAVNIVSLLVQLFLTSFVLNQLGVSKGIMVMPVLAAVGALMFFVSPILLTGSLLCVIDNSFNYSINQTSREALYVPLGKGDKYQAKAFIDIFGVRSAKVLGIGASLLVTTFFTEYSSLRWVSFIALGITVCWILVATWLGREYKIRSRAVEEFEATGKKVTA